MPKVAGSYQGYVAVKKVVGKVVAESKEAAIRAVLLELAEADDRATFKEWVKDGMKIELVPTVS